MSDREDDQTVDTVEIREVVGIVYNHNALEEMATQLVAAGVDRNDISLMADWNTVIEKLGLTYPDPGAVVDNPETPRRRLTTRDERATVTGTVFGTLIATGALAAGVPIIASGGAIPLALAACTAGGGIGAMLAKLVRKNLLTRDDADAIEHDINRGGIAVFVRVDNADEEQRTINIMRRNGAHNVHAHTITLRKELSDLSLANVQPDPWLADD